MNPDGVTSKDVSAFSQKRPFLFLPNGAPILANKDTTSFTFEVRTLFSEKISFSGNHQKSISASKPVKEASSFLSILKKNWPMIVAGVGILITYFMKQKSESKKQNIKVEKLLESLEKIDPGDKDELVKALVDGVKGNEDSKTE